MQLNKPITVYEHTKLSIGDQGFSEPQFNTLVKFNDLHKGKYFNVGFKKIIFKSYVGVIQVGNRVIEVLPKADKNPNLDEHTKTKWQKALLYMLKKSGYIKLNETDKAFQHTQNTNLMDVYLFAFLKETEQLLHGGLVKKYRRLRANQTALKGRLLIEKQIQKNTIHKERFFTEHTVYDRNNIYNQIIKTALEIIQDTTTNSSIKQEASKHLLYFEDISTWNGKASDFDSIKLDRKTLPYKYSLELARMIILNHCPDMKSGSNTILALLFDMNLLFEKFIYRMLKSREEQFKDHKLSIIRQNSLPFWEHKTIRPDIVITFYQAGEQKITTIIVDTKWKIVDEGYPSDNDLKQMFTYNMQFNSEHSILLYPRIDQENYGKKEYNKSLRNFLFSHSCEMHFIELFEKGTINNLFPEEFILYILKMKSASELKSSLSNA